MARALNLVKDLPPHGREAGWFQPPSDISPQQHVRAIGEGMIEEFELGEREGIKSADLRAHEETYESRERLLASLGVIIDRGASDPSGAIADLTVLRDSMSVMHQADGKVMERIKAGEEIPDHVIHQFIGHLAGDGSAIAIVQPPQEAPLPADAYLS